ncbi:MAG: SIR2 family protein [Elusimicrobia bacterium]|nr:SIR2 family protein [Candidatus Liberimonas magnetica]
MLWNGTNRKYICEIIRESSAGNVVFLAGAGVSILPPSSLPLAPELSGLLIKNIFQGEDKILSNIPFIRPEIIFEATRKVIGDRVFRLFEIFKSDLPNDCHLCLSALCAPILTTNFDELFEIAFEINGYRKEYHSGLSLSYTNVASGQFTTLVKLHGILNQPETIIAFLSKIYEGIDPEIYKYCYQLIRDKILVIIGYSCHDMDVFELIVDSQPSKIIWIDISFRDQHDSLRQQLMKRFQTHQVLCNIADFSKLFQSTHNYNKSLDHANSWKNCLVSFYLSLTKEEIEKIRGHIMASLGFADYATTLLEKYLIINAQIYSMSEKTKDYEHLAKDYFELGKYKKEAYRPYEEVSDILMKAFHFYKKADNWKGQCEVLWEVGLKAIDSSEWKSAERYFNDLAVIAEQNHFQIYMTLAKIGKALLHYWQSATVEDFKIALEEFEKSRSVLSKSGRYRDLLKVYRLIASVNFVRAKYKEALEADMKCYDIAKDIGDLKEQANCIRDMATCLRNLGEYKKPFVMYLDSLKLGFIAPDFNNYGITIGNASEMLLEQGFTQTALEGAKLSVYLLEKTKNELYKISFLQALSLAYTRCGNQDEGLRTIEKSIALAHNMHDYFEEAIARYTKSIILGENKRYSEMLNELKRTMDLASRTENKAIYYLSNSLLLFKENHVFPKSYQTIKENIQALDTMGAENEKLILISKVFKSYFLNPLKNPLLIFSLFEFISLKTVRCFIKRIGFVIWLKLIGEKRFHNYLSSIEKIAE